MIKSTRFRTFQFWDGAIFGAAVAIITTLFLTAAMLGASEAAAQKITIFAGIFAALLGAFFAFGAVHFRLSHERLQDLSSARAVLPLALTRLSSVCEEAIEVASDVSTSQTITLAQFLNTIALNEEIITILRDNIRAADPQSQRWITLIISRYQVAHARSQYWWDKPNSGYADNGGLTFSHARLSAIYDWAVLHSHVGHHFNYARSAVDQVPTRRNPSETWSSIWFARAQITLSSEDEKMLTRWVEQLGAGSFSDYYLGALK